MKINITGIENDISLERAIRAHDGISFRSEKRGASVVAEYVERLTDLAAHIEKHATDPRQQAIAQQVFDDLRAKYRKRTDAWIAARSRCISSMITGPARFPVRRAEKANNSEHKRLGELLEFSKAMDGYALKSLKWAIPKEEKAPAKAVKLPGLEIVENFTEDRLQLIFEGKPGEEIRTLLKRHGFKWSPRFTAWQRQLTGNARHALLAYILPAPEMAAYKAESEAA